MKNPLDFAVIDCETDPFKYGRIPQPFLWGLYDGKNYCDFERTADLASQVQTLHCDVYAHNGGRFDFHYLLDHTKPFTKFLVINGRIVEFKLGTANMRDSLAIVPVPLEEYAKTVIDYTKFEASERSKHLPEIKAYLRDDCVFLWNLISRFRLDYGTRATIASNAMNWFATKRQMKTEQLRSGKQLAADIRPFYYGGRVECFAKGDLGPSRTYDINSAYPFAMLHEHPCFGSYRVRKGWPKKFLPTGFYKIEATSDGCLPIRVDRTNKIAFPRCQKGTFFATGHEILCGLRHKKLVVHDVLVRYIFQHTINFRDYVTHFWNLKKATKPHTPEYIFAKLMLNSLYGKFAANPDNYRKYLSIPHDVINAVCQEQGYELEGPLGTNMALVSKELSEGEKYYYNVATAASITGFVRAFLFDTICTIRESNPKAVFYTDTDSLIVNVSLETSSELGAWKLEQCNRRTLIAGRKLYACQSTDGTWKIASKGAALVDKKDPQGTKLAASQIESMIEGATVVWRSEAPSFQFGGPTRFIERRIRAT